MRQLAIYLAVGATGFAIYLATYLLCSWLPDAVAVSIAYVVALAVHFTLNRRVTFASDNPAVHQVGRYLTLAGINYVVSTLVSVALLRLGLYPLLALFAGAICTTAIGFVASKHWVFG